MSLDGFITVLTSSDGHSWQLLTRITWAGGDMRDPKFVLDNNNLILMSGVRLAVAPNNTQHILSYTWIFDKKPEDFSLINSDQATWCWVGSL